MVTLPCEGGGQSQEEYERVPLSAHPANPQTLTHIALPA